MSLPSQARQLDLDLVRTVAIFGTVLIHATAVGGFNWAFGSAAWTANLFWSSLLRCAVPLFLMCSGALFLDPGRDLPLKTLWGKYMFRIAVALVFWATAYLVWGLWLQGDMNWPGLSWAIREFFKFRHRDHLYYLVLLLLVYAVLPLTQLFTAQAGKTLLTYGLTLWLLCGSVLPVLFTFWPFSLTEGTVREYSMRFTGMAVGLGVLGWLLHTQGKKLPAKCYALLYLGGFALTFFGTLALSLRRGELCWTLLQGNAPGVVLEAAGLFGLCLYGKPGARGRAVTTALSKASFCIYLVHLFFLDLLMKAGYYTGALNPVWSAPAETVVLVACGFVTWLVLRKVPLVKRYLI